MIKQRWVLVILVMLVELAYAHHLRPEASTTAFACQQETELRHQLGPADNINTFTLSDPLPEDRVEILNFLQPDWNNDAAETIKEMIWEKNAERLVIWLRQRNNHWYAFHHNIMPLESIETLEQ